VYAVSVKEATANMDLPTYQGTEDSVYINLTVPAKSKMQLYVKGNIVHDGQTGSYNIYHNHETTLLV